MPQVSGRPLVVAILKTTGPMDQESIVYGCIRDQPGDEQAREVHFSANRAAIAGLPEDDGFPLLAREMFGDRKSVV